MIVDVLQQFAEWLRDTDEGYSAIRVDVPRDPDTPPPPDARIICAADDSEDAKWAARNELPKEKLRIGPVLVVRVADTIDAGFSPMDGGTPARVPVAIVYGAIGDASNVEYRHGFQALRVVQRVIARRFNPQNPEYDRNGTKIHEPQGVTYLPFPENAADTVVVTGIVFNVPCDDSWAQGAVT